MSAPSPIFVGSADWHICRSAWKSQRGINGDSAWALEQVIDLCRLLGVPLVAAGDLLDTPTPSPDAVRDLRRQLGRMESANLPVYFIQGQHERVHAFGDGEAETVWLKAISGWPTWIHQTRITIFGVSLYGLDWQPANKLAEALADVPPDIDYFVGHQVWQDFGGHEGSFNDVPGRCAILTGDFHQTVIRPFGGGRVAYSPGALHRLTIAEPDKHGVFIFYSDGSSQFHEIDSRVSYRFTVTTPEDLDRLIADVIPLALSDSFEEATMRGLPATLRKPLLHVTYDAALPDVVDRIERVATGFFLFLKPQVGDVVIDGEVSTRGALETLRAGGLSSYVQAMDLTDLAADGVDTDRVRADVLRLLDSVDVRDELNALRAEFLV